MVLRCSCSDQYRNHIFASTSIISNVKTLDVPIHFKIICELAVINRSQFFFGFFEHFLCRQIPQYYKKILKKVPNDPDSCYTLVKDCC